MKCNTNFPYHNIMYVNMHIFFFTPERLHLRLRAAGMCVCLTEGGVSNTHTEPRGIILTKSRGLC